MASISDDSSKSKSVKRPFAALSHEECPPPSVPKDLHSAVPQILSCFAVGFSNFCEGMSLSYSSSLIPALQEEGSEIPITLSQGVFLGSVMVASMALGAPLAGLIMNYIGRLNTVRVSVVPFCAGWVLVATAASYQQILVGRVCTGVANVLGVSASTVFITEVASPHLRGALIGAFSTTIASTGVLATYVLGAYTPWRLAAWISAVIPVLTLVLTFLFSHESPIWLVSRGRTAEAEQSLRACARWNDSEDSREELPKRQLAWLVRRHEFAEAAKGREDRQAWYSAILDLFRLPVGYKPLIILSLVFVAQNFSGVYITLFYAAPFFQEMGVKVDKFEAAIYVGVTRFLAGVVAVCLIRTLGVRKPMVGSSFGMAICMVLSGYFTLYPSKGMDGWVAVGLVIAYVAFSCCGLLTLPWTMTAELFPDQLRDAGQAVMIFNAYTLMFIGLEMYPTLRSTLEYGPISGAVGIQWFFAAVALVSVVLFVFFLPETRGKTLQQIEEHFAHRTLWLGQHRKEKSSPETSLAVSAISTSDFRATTP